MKKFLENLKLRSMTLGTLAFCSLVAGALYLETGATGFRLGWKGFSMVLVFEVAKVWITSRK